MKIKKDNMSIAKHFGTLLIGAGIAYGTVTTVLKAHIENNYVHKDISTLEETFVRKDVLGAHLQNINEKLERISREMGIE